MVKLSINGNEIFLWDGQKRKVSFLFRTKGVCVSNGVLCMCKEEVAYLYDVQGVIMSGALFMNFGKDS